MNAQNPDALRLADALAYCDSSVASQAARELRRLHAENETLQQDYDAARLEIDHLRGATKMMEPPQPSPTTQADSQPALPKITAEDRSFLYYSPNTDAIVEWVCRYASAAITADRAARAPADSVLEDAARWRAWAAAIVEASANGDGDTPFMKAFSDAIGDSEAPFTTEQFAAWVDAARKQVANHEQ